MRGGGRCESAGSDANPRAAKRYSVTRFVWVLTTAIPVDVQAVLPPTRGREGPEPHPTPGGERPRPPHFYI